MNYENEEWKDIIITKNGVLYDYSGLYQVSNYGRVRSLGNDKERKERILKQSCNSSGYLYVRLSKDGKVKNSTVHRLVANAFIPNAENLPVVNHKNEDKSCNVWTNLEWCTHRYNCNYGTKGERLSKKLKGRIFTEEHKQKLKDNHADRSGSKNPCYGRTGDKNTNAHKVICLETKQVFDSIKDAEKWCGKTGVSDCCRGRCKTIGGYHWQYLDDHKREQRMITDINNSRLIA